MSAQAVFIVDKVKNTLVFLDQLDENIRINQKQLSNILGKIVSNCKDLKLNSFSNFEINGNSYFYGVFEKFLIIIQHLKNTPPPEELLIELYGIFTKVFANILDNYTNNDLPKFRSFVKVLREILPKYINHTCEQDIAIGDKPIIDPIKRDFYPERPSVYKRDEILWTEARLIKQEYATQYVDGLIFKLHIYFKISSAQCYKIYIDFSDYPLKPTIILDNELSRELGEDLDEKLYFYRSWDKKRPPHIIEIIKELETVLLQYYSKGRLSKIPELHKIAIPEIKPLPNIEIGENENEKN